MVAIFEKKFLKKCQHRSIFTTHGTVRWQSSQRGDWPSLCISSIHSALKSFKIGQNKSPTLAVHIFLCSKIKSKYGIWIPSLWVPMPLLLFWHLCPELLVLGPRLCCCTVTFWFYIKTVKDPGLNQFALCLLACPQIFTFIV